MLVRRPNTDHGHVERAAPRVGVIDLHRERDAPYLQTTPPGPGQRNRIPHRRLPAHAWDADSWPWFAVDGQEQAPTVTTMLATSHRATHEAPTIEVAPIHAFFVAPSGANGSREPVQIATTTRLAERGSPIGKDMSRYVPHEARTRNQSASVVIGGPYPVLDCLNPRELATFYCELLGWEVADDDAGEDDPGWVGLRSPDGQMMSLQREPRYEPPTWPADGTHQQMMIHLDFQVADVNAALAKAVELCAALTPWQPQADVRVCTDPVGHALCLFG